MRVWLYTEVVVFIQECDSLLNCQAGKWRENRNKPGKSFYPFDLGKMINFHVDTPEETEMSAVCTDDFSIGLHSAYRKCGDD